jgi:hypothetical protein
MQRLFLALDFRGRGAGTDLVLGSGKREIMQTIHPQTDTVTSSSTSHLTAKTPCVTA